MKIDKIKKMNHGKYKITLENNEKIITYDDVILKNNLLFHQELDTSLLNEVNKETKYYDVYYKTVRYITTRLRSEKEIDEYLEKNEVLEEEKKVIKKQLKEIGLLNDPNFVKAYISDKIRLTSMGPLKIRNELLKHDIDCSLIDQELDQLDETFIREKIEKYVSKKVTANKKYSNYVLKQKLYQELNNLGYPTGLIKEYLDNINEKNNSIEKEYDKLYSKLSKKYNEDKLLFYIKQKLYSKGYHQNEIEEVIQKKASN